MGGTVEESLRYSRVFGGCGNVDAEVVEEMKSEGTERRNG
jgi:hypothetical protein